ncbi:hypothetical protein WOSG25_080250 [Weissella oryzae SG25]|uniref:Mannosyl-glycoprotein endo-beta-N-acetylglucosamidase-like domain-containing protein n=1 Tax=Weissella oryzae (strain DSM 25784 / JCM 18191 / LMG 30913 / SG25) TaxID=1329250 RepID=A0A069CVE1_WEIOS|nr:glycoside hydrolase family 73 protein [Weissella oryzae]GAK31193.1 hypothetical protein WOSG25_080250 [Weissella oryzae SG25]
MKYKKIWQYVLVMFGLMGGLYFAQNNTPVHADAQQDFINQIAPGSQQATRENGLYTSIQMAQAILESGWGKSELATNASNYFGVKGAYNGQSYDVTTAEYDSDTGQWYNTVAAFKKYPSVYTSMLDNASLLRNNARYSDVWRENAPTYQDAAKGLSTGGYATDPNYPNKLIALIQQYDLERFDTLADPKYTVGETVQIAPFALSESNGYDLTTKQNWVGIVKSVTPQNMASSNYEYYIDYGNGQQSMHVLEQDLQPAPVAQYKVGNYVRVANFATNEANGADLTNHQGWSGVVQSVSINNVSSSHYSYNVKYNDGSSNQQILEQDLSLVPPVFSPGQTVQIKNSANVESNGYDLTNRRGWVGTVKVVNVMNMYNSHYEYYIDYGNGIRSEHVLEQDLDLAPQSTFKVGQTVEIKNTANIESNGYDLSSRRKWIGTVKSYTPMNMYGSHYEYYVDYGDGQQSMHVLEQDLQIPTTPKFTNGQTVQIKNSANIESNGYDLTNRRGWVGTIKSNSVKNMYGSHYEYYVDYGDGQQSMHVLEQDLTSAVEPKFAVGQQVKIKNVATAESNGYSLVNHRGWVGTVKTRLIKNAASSHYEYYIKYPNGEVNEHVLEQDLQLP